MSVHTSDKYGIFCRVCHKTIVECNILLQQHNQSPQMQKPLQPQLQQQPPPHPPPLPQPLKLPLFECSYCGQLLSGMTVLKVHERSHTKEKPYMCTVCGDSFETNQNRIRHENTKHDILPPPVQSRSNVQCTNCVRCFSTVKIMERHLVTCYGI
jgi:hypothetical protein